MTNDNVTPLLTVKELRSAIKKSTSIHVQPRFGCSERWVKITKASALDLIKQMGPDATPDSFEMYTGAFGYVHKDGAVDLG